MKHTVIRCLALAFIGLTLTLLLCGCGVGMTPGEMPEELRAGETFQLTMTRFDESIPAENFYYASSDASVATVSETGLITAVKEGKTDIVIQHKENHRRVTVDIQVSYGVVDQLNPTLDTRNYAITYPTDRNLYPFFSRNGYSERVDDWDIIEIAKIVAGKHEDEYVFTDVYCNGWGIDNTFILLADWGNDNVSLDPAVLEQADLSSYLTETLGLSADRFSSYSEDQAMQTIKSEISSVMKNMEGEIALSELSDQYEYRVSVVIGYHTYQTDNFHSRGMLKGGWNLLVDIWNWEISSFLNSYTYVNRVDEIVLDQCTLVIERRVK